jgi:DNA-directed RNA polymerase subunit N (RpoN/RPB10)
MNNYNNVDSDKSNEIESKLNEFKDYSQIVKNNLKSQEKIESSQNALNTLKTIIEEEILNYLKESFSNLDLLITNNNTIDLTLKKENRRRNLVDVHINYIQEAFDLFQKNYLKKTNELKSAAEIINLQKEYSNFQSILKNSVKNVGNPIPNYLDILKNYLSDSQFTSFSNKLNNQLANINTYVNDFLTKESAIIDESLNLVIKILPDLFNSNKNLFKSSIDTSLLNLYNIIMPNVNNVDKSESNTINNIAIGSYTAHLPNNNYNFNSAVNNLKYKNIIKFYYNNDYTFTIDLSSNNVVSLSSSFQTSNKRGGFNGIIADMTISIKFFNNFVIERVDFQAINENKDANYNTWTEDLGHDRYCCKRIIGICTKRCTKDYWYNRKSKSFTEKPFKTSFKKTYQN